MSSKSFLFDMLDRISDVVIEHRPGCLNDHPDESCYGGDLDNPCVHCVPLIHLHKLLRAVQASDDAAAIEKQAQEGQIRLDRVTMTLDRLATRLEAAPIDHRSEVEQLEERLAKQTECRCACGKLQGHKYPCTPEEEAQSPGHFKMISGVKHYRRAKLDDTEEVTS